MAVVPRGGRRAARGRQGPYRVRVLADPPTDYQRWMLWADPWYAEAGEDIRYLPRSARRTSRLALDHDWWLLDDERRSSSLASMTTGTSATRTLVTEPVLIAQLPRVAGPGYPRATPAEQIAAA